MNEGAGYLSDPSGSDPIRAAVHWIGTGMLGTMATTLAAIAIATIGLLMLSGRLPLRRGISTVTGCFLLFRATAIASALMALPPSTSTSFTRAGTAPPFRN